MKASLPVSMTQNVGQNGNSAEKNENLNLEEPKLNYQIVVFLDGV